MKIDCKNCKSKITIAENESTFETKIITCNICKEEFIYHSQTSFLENRLNELEKDLVEKESRINDQNTSYNEKIKFLELELKNKKVS